MVGPREVAPGVFGLGTELVNWYLVEDAGRLTAVDAGLPKFAEGLEADLSRIGFSAADVDAVVLTHSDGDHTGVAARLQAAGARVLVHVDDDAALRKPGPKKGDASMRHVLGNMWRRESRAVFTDTVRHGGLRPTKVEGAETFSDGDVLDVPGRPRVIHTPGHTAGHSCLLFEGKSVLFAGDAMITHALITKGTGPQLMPRWVNEDNAACLLSLDRFDDVDADLTLFGHGDPWADTPSAAAGRARAAVQSR